MCFNHPTDKWDIDRCSCDFKDPDTQPANPKYKENKLVFMLACDFKKVDCLY